MSRFTDFANALLSSVPAEGIIEVPDVGAFLSVDYAADGRLLSPQVMEMVRPSDASRRADYRNLSGSRSISKGLPLVSVFAAAVERILMAGRIRPQEGWSLRDFEYARRIAPFPDSGYAVSLSSVSGMVRDLRGRKMSFDASTLRVVDAFFRNRLGITPMDDVDLASLYNIVLEARATEESRKAFFESFSVFVHESLRSFGDSISVEDVSAEDLMMFPERMYEVMRGKLFRDAVIDQSRASSLDFIRQEGALNGGRVFHDTPLGSVDVVDWVKERNDVNPVLADSRVLPVCVPCAFFANSLDDALAMGEVAATSFTMGRTFLGNAMADDLKTAVRALTETVWRFTHVPDDQKDRIVDEVCEKYGLEKPSFDVEKMSLDSVGEKGVNYNPVRTLMCAMGCAFNPANADGVDALFSAARVGGDMPTLAYLTAALSEARFGLGARENKYIEELAFSHIGKFTHELSDNFEEVFVTPCKRQRRVAVQDAVSYIPSAEVKDLSSFVSNKRKSHAGADLKKLDGVRMVKAICFEGSGCADIGMEPIFFLPDDQLEAKAGKLMKMQLDKIYGHEVTLLPESEMDRVFDESRMRCHPEIGAYLHPSEINESNPVGAYVETARAYRDSLVIYKGTVKDLFHTEHPDVVKYMNDSYAYKRYDVFMSENGFTHNGVSCMSFKQIADAVNEEFYRALGLDHDALGGDVVPLSAARVVLEHNEDGSLYFGLKRGDFKLGGFSFAPGGGIARDNTMESVGEYLNSEYCMRHPFMGARFYETKLLMDSLGELVLDCGLGIQDDKAVIRSVSRTDERAHYYESKGRGDYGEDSFAVRNADFYSRMARLEDTGSDADPLDTRVLEPDGEHKSEPKRPNLDLAYEDLSMSVDQNLVRGEGLEVKNSSGVKL